MSDALCECHLPPFCDCCQREVNRVVRNPIIHDTMRICFDCFSEWYDGDGETDAIIIGNRVRAKHGLCALERE
jgi:hypothetical protein